MDDARRRDLTGTQHPGFFGKVPTHGDFVSGGLSRSLLSALDRWIDEGMLEAQEGSDWEKRFRTMPSWRFVVQPPIWSSATVVGILTPSRDRVGRSFPLVVAAQIADFDGNPQSLCFDKSWFTAAEALGESTRFRDFDLTRFTDGLKRLRLPYARQGDAGESRSGTPRAIWWTIDSADGRADGFMAVGKLEGSDFAKLLPAVPEASPAPASPAVPLSADQLSPASSAPPALAERSVAMPPRFSLARSYATHAGTSLESNTDSLLISGQPDLFAVADGIGSDHMAKHAARLATNTLSEVSVPHDLNDFIRDIKGKLGKANSLLTSRGLSGEAAQGGASIAVLAFTDDAAAVLWMGDARCYLVRDGMMRCLTSDHVEIGIKRRLSRYLGARMQPAPDVLPLDVEPGDRYLLCAASLPRVLGERTIADILLEEELESAAKRLVQEALISNVRDNISVVVVDVRAADER